MSGNTLCTLDGTPPSRNSQEYKDQGASAWSRVLEYVQYRDSLLRSISEDLDAHAIDLVRLVYLVDTVRCYADGDVVLPPASASAVSKLHFLHLFEDGEIAELTGVPTWLINDAILRSRRTPKQRQVMALHVDGYTPRQISDQLGVYRENVHRWLGEACVTPHTVQVTLPDRYVEQAAALYRAGKSYARIAAALDVAEGQVSVLLRRAQRNGILPEYGSRWGVAS